MPELRTDMKGIVIEDHPYDRGYWASYNGLPEPVHPQEIEGWRNCGIEMNEEREEERVRSLESGKSSDPFQIVVPPHPMKYPKHEGSKGSVYGGYCNRTACDSAGAYYLNVGTKGYYCRACAIGINQGGNSSHPLCVAVDRHVPHDKMNAMERRFNEEYAREANRKRAGARARGAQI